MTFIQKTKSTFWLAASMCVCVASTVNAETILRATGGQFELKGELLSISDEAYTIQTDLGELIVRREFVTCEGDGCPGSETAEAEPEDNEIRLSSPDGSIELVGELVEVTETEYVVDTVMGRLTVRSEFVTCEGAACPSTLVQSDRIGITVAGPVTADLIATILDEYSSSKDFSVSQQVGDNDMRQFLIGNTSGEEVAKVDVVQTDIGGALQSLLAGQTAMALTWNRITPEMLSKVLNLPVENINEILNENVIGLDAVSLTVNPNNVADVVGIEAMRDILVGNVQNWSQLGGTDAPIQIHLLSTNTELHEQLILRGLSDPALQDRAVMHANPASLKAALAADRNALGITYRSQADDMKTLNLVAACNIFADSSDFSIQTEEYPLTLRLYEYTLKGGLLADFVRNVDQFLDTDFGQAAIAKRGLVTQELQIKPMQVQGARVISSVLAGGGDSSWARVTRNYFDEASNARRISTALRFVVGSAILDAKANEDVERITEIVRANEYAGYQVLVFGFSDSTGGFNANIALSQKRAEAVAEILRARSRGYLEDGSVRSFGMGPIAPIGCNASAEGRELNRRVEIWLRPRA